MLSLDELGRELELGVRQLEAESTSGSADRGAALQSSELAEHDDVIGIVPFEVRLQVAQAPEPEVIFEHRRVELEVGGDLVNGVSGTDGGWGSTSYEVATVDLDRNIYMAADAGTCTGRALRAPAITFCSLRAAPRPTCVTRPVVAARSPSRRPLRS